MIDFEPVTILYGGNGSGKTTALNVIAEKLNLQRDSLYNRSNFFEDYMDKKYGHFQMRSLADYDQLKKVNSARRSSQSQYIRKNLSDNVWFFGCQFVIATHSPFLLSMPQAKIYDLDEEIVDVKKWFELANVRAYYEFFKKHEQEFTKIKNEH